VDIWHFLIQTDGWDWGCNQGSENIGEVLRGAVYEVEKRFDLDSRLFEGRRLVGFHRHRNSSALPKMTARGRRRGKGDKKKEEEEGREEERETTHHIRWESIYLVGD